MKALDSSSSSNSCEVFCGLVQVDSRKGLGEHKLRREVAGGEGGVVQRSPN